MNRVIAQGDFRSMADNKEAMADLERILAARTPLYARADAIVETAGRAVEAGATQPDRSDPPMLGLALGRSKVRIEQSARLAEPVKVAVPLSGGMRGSFPGKAWHKDQCAVFDRKI